MIGKPLSHRYVLGVLPSERAVATMTDLLAAQAAPLVEVRKQGPHMVACLVSRADQAAVRLCRRIGIAMKRDATGVFGLAGPDAAGLLPELSDAQRASLAVPCGPRETKVVLVAGGIALLSVEAHGGKVTVTAVT